MKIYETKEWKGLGKSYYWNEYHLDGNVVTKYKCSRIRSFDGKESDWYYNKDEVESWDTDDPSMPDWLKQYI